VQEIVEQLMASDRNEPVEPVKERFYRVKQALLDRCEGDPDAVRLVASIGWDAVSPRLAP
jgi:hypothetical protein